ncbi:MAG: MFS transporter [Patescibacteria group bacterium]
MIQKLKNLLPASDLNNIKFYYLLVVFTNFWFLSANWLFFWLKFMDYNQLAIIDALTFGAGLLMEIPSGAISDLFGKKKTIVLGTGTAFISIMLMSQASHVSTFFFAQLFLLIGWALNSGAVEALVYDTLLEKNRADEYEKVVSHGSSLASWITIIAVFVGGYLYEWHFRLPTVAWGLTYAVSFLMALRLIEPKIDSDKFSWLNYWQQLKTGTLALFKKSLLAYSVVIFSLVGGYYLYDFGFLKLTMLQTFGFSPFEQSQIFTILYMIGATIVLAVPWLRKKISDKKGLYLLTVLLGLGYLSSYYFAGWLGLVSILMIELSGYLVYPWISVVVNKEIESKYRATTLSALALISKIPYVLLAVVAGRFAENNKIGEFNAYVGVFILASILLSAGIYKLSKRKKSPIILII